MIDLRVGIKPRRMTANGDLFHSDPSRDARYFGVKSDVNCVSKFTFAFTHGDGGCGYVIRLKYAERQWFRHMREDARRQL